MNKSFYAFKEVLINEKNRLLKKNRKSQYINKTVILKELKNVTLRCNKAY